MRQFRLPYDLIVLDLEANQPSGEIIEIGAVKLTRDGGVHPHQFGELVRIKDHLGACDTRGGRKTITELTGISEQMLKEADYFPGVAARFKNWAMSESKNILLASWGNWDIPCLRKDYEKHGLDYPFRGKSIDIKSIGVWVNLVTGHKVKGDGLSTMMKSWGLKFKGDKHRGKDDAYNTALLLQVWWNFYRDQGEYLLNAAKKLGIFDRQGGSDGRLEAEGSGKVSDGESAGTDESED